MIFYLLSSEIDLHIEIRNNKDSIILLGLSMSLRRFLLNLD